MKSIAIILCIIPALLFCGCVTKKDLVRLDDRLRSLERRMDQRDAEVERKFDEIDKRLDDLQKNLTGDGKALRDQSAGLYAAMAEMENSLRAMNGRFEEADHRLGQDVKGIQTSSREALADMAETAESREKRIARLEQYLNLEAAKPGEAPPAPPVKKSLAELIDAAATEEEVYSLAKQAFDQGAFEAARQGFQRVLNEWADSKNADNAQFWMGETYYKEEWYQKAILEYQKVIENYPKGNKVQAALLKQGFAFYNLEGDDKKANKANARLILRELVRKYPKSNEAKIAKKKLKEF
ncbi:MAG: tol-pal system protein YbgF [Desulfobacterales bacterium]|nr:tol-pal system protein YbgF [Desulfobacterales bacterium]